MGVVGFFSSRCDIHCGWKLALHLLLILVATALLSVSLTGCSGEDQAWEDGRKAGIEEGRAEGEKKGIEEGIEKGRATCAQTEKQKVLVLEACVVLMCCPTVYCLYTFASILLPWLNAPPEAEDDAQEVGDSSKSKAEVAAAASKRSAASSSKHDHGTKKREKDEKHSRKADGHKKRGRSHSP